LAEGLATEEERGFHLTGPLSGVTLTLAPVDGSQNVEPVLLEGELNLRFLRLLVFIKDLGCGEAVPGH
jgi:hypothetical protein